MPSSSLTSKYTYTVTGDQGSATSTYENSNVSTSSTTTETENQSTSSSSFETGGITQTTSGSVTTTATVKSSNTNPDEIVSKYESRFAGGTFSRSASIGSGENSSSYQDTTQTTLRYNDFGLVFSHTGIALPTGSVSLEVTSQGNESSSTTVDRSSEGTIGSDGSSSTPVTDRYFHRSTGSTRTNTTGSQWDFTRKTEGDTHRSTGSRSYHDRFEVSGNYSESENVDTEGSAFEIVKRHRSDGRYAYSGGSNLSVKLTSGNGVEVTGSSNSAGTADHTVFNSRTYYNLDQTLRQYNEGTIDFGISGSYSSELSVDGSITTEGVSESTRTVSAFLDPSSAGRTPVSNSVEIPLVNDRFEGDYRGFEDPVGGRDFDGSGFDFYAYEEGYDPDAIGEVAASPAGGSGDQSDAQRDDSNQNKAANPEGSESNNGPSNVDRYKVGPTYRGFLVRLYFGKWSVDQDFYHDTFRFSEKGLKQTVATGIQRLRIVEYIDFSGLTDSVASIIEGFARGDEVKQIAGNLAKNAVVGIVQNKLGDRFLGGKTPRKSNGVLDDFDKIKASNRTHLHYSIPKEIQKKLPPHLRNDRDIIGRAGLPNRRPVEARKHLREVHDKTGISRVETGIGGGRYNLRFQ